MTKLVSVKTLRGQLLSIGVHQVDDLWGLKREIQRRVGLPVEYQELVFKGKVPDAELSLEDLGLEEGDFFVLVPCKKKQPKKTKSSPKSSDSFKEPAPKRLRIVPPSSSLPEIVFASVNPLHLQQLVSMGFDSSRAKSVLESCGNDLSSATHVLLEESIDSSSEIGESSLNPVVDSLDQSEEHELYDEDYSDDGHSGQTSEEDDE